MIEGLGDSHYLINRNYQQSIILPSANQENHGSKNIKNRLQMLKILVIFVSSNQ